MSEDEVPKQLDVARFRALCLLVRDHGRLFPEDLQSQIAARFLELLPGPSGPATVLATAIHHHHVSVSVVGLEVTAQVGTVAVNKRPRGRPPSRSAMVADIVNKYMADGCSQPDARRQAAEILGLALRTVKNRHGKAPKRRRDSEADVW